VTRQVMKITVNEKANDSPEMAIQLPQAFGSTPETWRRMQIAIDPPNSLKRETKIHVGRYAPQPATGVPLYFELPGSASRPGSGPM